MLQYSQWKEDDFGKKVHIGETGFNKEEPHPETPALGEHEVTPPKGKIYDKKPFQIALEIGKKYSWCACGHSKSQVWLLYIMLTCLCNKMKYVKDLEMAFIKR